jgi:hypothetical protein
MSKSEIEKELEEKEAELGRLRIEAKGLAEDSAEGAAARSRADRLQHKVIQLRSEFNHAK